MSRVLLVGMAPLPTENARRSYAPGLRTWQFAKALAHAGHAVTLACVRMPYIYELDRPPIVKARDPDLGFERYDFDERVLHADFLARLLRTVRPDCVVGAHTFASWVASTLRTALPLWADLNGHLMAEAQTKACRDGDDLPVGQLWRWEQAILDRADAFSVCSTPQYYATLGELGARGRLNRHTCGYPFVHVVPDTYPPARAVAPVQVRGVLVPEDAFIALWSGAYNTWADVDTLFHGLERAMEVEPRLYFVSTGGQIESHDERTYPRLLSLIAASPHRARFVMRGWLPAEEIPSYLAQADVAINLDARTVEAELGTRTRLLDWAAHGTPIISTTLCELARELDQLGLLLGIPPHDADALCAALLRAARAPAERRQMAVAAAAYVRERYGWEATTRALVAWCVAPAPAPDRAAVGPHAGARALAAAGAPRTRARHIVADLGTSWRRYGVRGLVRRSARYLRRGVQLALPGSRRLSARP
ncbi:MAG: glycosyltransferase [Chloroflexi bacterium]|nr:glycosyltransferase [Chloroflexota bacterium]